MIDTKKITPDFSSSTAFLKSGESLTLCENTVKDKTLIVMNARLERISGEAKLVVGHAYKEKRGGWLEIGEHTVSAYNHIPWKSPSDHPLFVDLPHGLLIKDFVTVVINKDMANGEYAEISTSGGSFKFSVSGIAGYDGSPIVTPEGLHLSEVSLSFTADAYRTPIWIYGDSYLSHNEDDRWPYYLYKNGYTNMLLSGFPGEGAPRALVDFKTSLTRGTPKFALWLLGMNNGDPWHESAQETEETKENPEAAKKLRKIRAAVSDCKGDTAEELLSKINPHWLGATEEFIKICNERGITPILATIPQTPKINNLPKNEWVRRSGYRYIDFNLAVGADLDPAWLPDMLHSDEVHPLPLGAKALYERVVADFPEIKEKK